MRRKGATKAHERSQHTIDKVHHAIEFVPNDKKLTNSEATIRGYGIYQSGHGHSASIDITIFSFPDSISINDPFEMLLVANSDN